MHEESVFTTPFFHFDITSEEGISIFTSQDHGDNTLMSITEKEFGFVDKTV